MQKLVSWKLLTGKPMKRKCVYQIHLKTGHLVNLHKLKSLFSSEFFQSNFHAKSFFNCFFLRFLFSSSRSVYVFQKLGKFKTLFLNLIIFYPRKQFIVLFSKILSVKLPVFISNRQLENCQREHFVLRTKKKCFPIIQLSCFMYKFP